MVAPKLVPGKCWKALNNARIHQDRTNRTRLLPQIEDYFKEAIADHWSCLICVRCHLAWKFLQPQTCVLEESKTQWKSWLEGFEVHGQRPMKKRNCMIFDKYIASICYPMLYLCYPSQSQCLVFFRIDAGPLDTISVRHRSFDESDESAVARAAAIACHNLTKIYKDDIDGKPRCFLVAMVSVWSVGSVWSPLLWEVRFSFHQGRRSQRHKTITYSYYIYIVD